MSRIEHPNWEQVWLAEAIRIAEETGPLDDTQALARVQRLPMPERDKLLERAWQLGQRLGWTAQLEHLRDAGWWLLLLVAGGVVALANGLLFSVLADGRSINAASGFVSALGFHALSLLFWLLSIPMARRQRRANSGLAGFSIGRWFLAAVSRLPFWRGPQTAALAQAGRSLVARERLSAWAFGLVSHLVWTFGFAFMLLGLLFAFAFRQYQLTWETTILAPDWFAAFARITGYLPSLLGVPVPSPTKVAEGVQNAGAWPAREAATWLLACVALYGLLPRALCAAWCAWVLRRAARRVDIDVAQPYYQQLRARLQALEPAHVTDAEHPAEVRQAVARSRSGAAYAGSAVLGFEIDCASAWLPSALASSAGMALCIAGTMPEQLQAQAQLAALLPARLLVLCNPHASPDRGTLRFLREASYSAEHCALTFAAPQAEGDADGVAGQRQAGIDRWRLWIQSSELRDWQFFEQRSVAEQWAIGNEGANA